MGPFYFPIYIVGGFNLFTLLMYVIAPYHLYGENVVFSYFYILLNILFIIFGYTFGLKSGFRRIAVGNISYRDERKIFNFIIYFYSVTFLIKYAYLLRFPIFDIVGMVDFLLVGVLDPQTGYRLSVNDLRPHTVSWSVYFLVTIFNSIFFVIILVTWTKLSRLKKAVSIFFVIVDIFFWVGRGTNFGLVSLLLIFLFAKIMRIDKFDFKSIFLIIALFFLSLIIFSVIMNFRGGSSEDLQVYSLINSLVNEESLMFSLLPKAIHSDILLIFSYVTQGYYYMSFAFDLDFKSTWLGGSTPAIVSLYEAFGLNVFENSYVHRLTEYGIDPSVNWHSAYTWYANDVSFFLVPIISFVIGWILGVTWVKSLISNDILAKVLFLIFAPASIFIFANNNYLSNYFYTLIFLVPIFIYRNYFRLGKVSKPSPGVR